MGRRARAAACCSALMAPGRAPLPFRSQEPAPVKGKVSATGQETTRCLFQTTYDRVASVLSSRRRTLVAFPARLASSFAHTESPCGHTIAACRNPSAMMWGRKLVDGGRICTAVHHRCGTDPPPIHSASSLAMALSPMDVHASRATAERDADESLERAGHSCDDGCYDWRSLG